MIKSAAVWPTPWSTVLRIVGYGYASAASLAT